MDHGGAFLMPGFGDVHNHHLLAVPAWRIATRRQRRSRRGARIHCRLVRTTRRGRLGGGRQMGKPSARRGGIPRRIALAGRCSRRSSGDAQRRQLSQLVAQHTSHVPGGTRHGHRRSRRRHRARRGNLIAGGRTGRGRSYPRRTRLRRTTCGLDRSPRGKLHPRHRNPAQFRNPRCPSPQSWVSRRR